MPVVGGEYAVLHLRRESYGERAHLVEGGLCGIAPEQAVEQGVNAQVPVHKGQEDGVILQSLGLVDGEDAYATGLAAGDGTGGEVVVPRLQKLMNVLRIVAQIALQLVHERQHIGILPLDALQLQHIVEPFGEQEQWQTRHLLAVGGQFGRQHILWLLVHHLVKGDVEAQYVLLVMQHQVSKHYGVGFLHAVCGQLHSRYQHLHRDGCLEQESLVADQLDVGGQAMEERQEL